MPLCFGTLGNKHSSLKFDVLKIRIHMGQIVAQQLPQSISKTAALLGAFLVCSHLCLSKVVQRRNRGEWPMTVGAQ